MTHHATASFYNHKKQTRSTEAYHTSCTMCLSSLSPVMIATRGLSQSTHEDEGSSDSLDLAFFSSSSERLLHLSSALQN